MDVRPITPDLVDDYFRLFDNAFDDNPHWAGCYCALYDDPRRGEAWDTEQEGFAQANRAFRREWIGAGRAHGLLAYAQEVPIGWVNAGPREHYGNLRIFEAAVEADDPPIGAILCFVIHPDHRKQGVATTLLDAVEGHLRGLGMEVAEGYPRRAPPDADGLQWTAAFYKGTRTMYERAGYRVHREFERFISMRKQL